MTSSYRVEDIGPPVTDDGFRCYQLAHAALREIGVRQGMFPPMTDTEWRWLAEGPRPIEQLENARLKIVLA